MGMPKVAVIGGSIAGLTAANLLRDAKCDVAVYERCSTLLSGFGTGIVVQPELVRYLLERTSTTLEEISVASSAMCYYDAATGLKKGEVASDWRFTAYNAIYRRLLDVFGTEDYHLGKELVGIDLDGELPTASFADGTQVSADLLVCADGGSSVARAQLLGVSPTYAGYVTWRGMVDESDVSDDIWSFFQGTFTYGLLPDGHIIAYPICQVTSDGEVTGRARINFQWYWNVEEGEALDGLMTAKDGGRRPVTVHFKDLSSTSLDTFRNRALNELVSPFRDLLSAAPNPFVTTISDCEPQNVAFDRVALIGDAAITPRPHAAAGAAKAAADAWRLVDHLLATSGDVQGALRAWEPERLAVGRAYLSKVRAMAAVLQHGGPFPPGAAEFRFGLPPPD